MSFRVKKKINNEVKLLTIRGIDFKVVSPLKKLINIFTSFSSLLKHMPYHNYMSYLIRLEFRLSLLLKLLAATVLSFRQNNKHFFKSGDILNADGQDPLIWTEIIREQKIVIYDIKYNSFWVRMNSCYL
jgi:hypothetical protein